MSDSLAKIFRAEAPSNIALIKYWGKDDAAKQWPANDSISMTLDQARTITQVAISDDPGATQDQLWFDDRLVTLDSPFGSKVANHVRQLKQRFDRPQTRLKIKTRNTFPHGCGIASSASGFAALTIAVTACLTESKSFEELQQSHGISRLDLGQLARQGSGSAGRSLWGGFVAWRRNDSAENQTLEPLFAAEHWQLANTIILLESGEKAVSSREAHSYAKGSPLFEVRTAGLPEKIQQVEWALAKSDLDLLGPLIEAEALEMHSVAMTGTPPVHYLKDSTLSFLIWLRQVRRQSGLKAFATIDAGANIHVIHEKPSRPELQRMLQRYPGGSLNILEDEVGCGPKLVCEE